MQPSSTTFSTRTQDRTALAEHRTRSPSPCPSYSFALLLLLLASPLAAATFTVNDTGNAGDHTPGDGSCEILPAGSGLCTLRAAIAEANASAGADTIDFAIPAAQCPTNQVCDITNPQLPTIQEQLTIDGYTQTGAAQNSAPTTRVTNAQIKISIINGGSGCIDIDHLAAPADETEGTLVQGLSISGCSTAIAMSTPYNTIQGNFIGTEVDGSAVATNDNSGDGISCTFSGTDDTGANLIGGFLPTEWNLISGNGGDGIDLNSSGNLVLGNLIGTDALGASDVGNFSNGISIGRDDNQIGMDVPLTGRDLPVPAVMGNLISGNRLDGIDLSSTADDNWIGGNVIGADTLQLNALPNDDHGVHVSGTDNHIGTEAVGALNVIAGNGEHGVAILSTGATGNTVSGNFIGITFDATNLTLYQALGNGCDGVRIGSNDNVIGGALLPGQGNYIGGNVGCGNANGPGHGIEITASSSNNEILGNWIGLDPNGIARPNAADGISMLNNAQNNQIGDGSLLGANLIGPNGPPTANLAIDLDNDGPDVNDHMDIDSGSGHPNNRQNFPVIASAVNDATSTTISGTLNSNPGVAFVIQIFSSAAGELGQARRFEGSATTAATNASGDISWQVVVSSPQVAMGRLVTATATPVSSSPAPTSELSASAAVTQPGYGSVPAPGGALALGSAAVGSSVAGSLVISETGNASLTVQNPMITGANAADFAITTPTFPIIVADGGASVTVSVQCTPSAAGPRSATLQLATNDPLVPNPSYPLSCTGLAAGYGSTPPPGSAVNVGSVAVGANVTTDIVVMETGDADLTVQSPVFTGGNAADFAVISTMPLLIMDGGANAMVTVACTPSAPGPRSSALQLTTNDPSQTTVSYPVSCTGTQPGFGSNPPPGGTLAVGSTSVGSSVSASLTLMETGDADLDVDLVSIAGAHAGDFAITAPPLPVTVADGGAAVSLDVQCTPSATGARTATLTLLTNDPTQTNVSYNLSCTGLAPATPGYGSAPPVGSTITISTSQSVVGTSIVTVSETGDADLIVSSFAVTGGPELTVSGPGAPFTIADGGASVPLTVNCSSAATGSFGGTLTVAHNAAGSPATYPVDCTVTAPPQPGYGSTPPPGSVLSFGSVAVGATGTALLSVGETGNAPLTVSMPTITSTNSGDFAVTAPTFPLTLADGAPSQSVTVTCTPSASGLRTATLQMTTNDTTRPTVTYPLTCSGTQPGFSSNPAPGTTLVVGSVTVGSTVSTTLSVVETGNATLTVTAANVTGMHAADYVVTAPGFPFSVVDGGPAQPITVQCSPSLAGSRVALLTLATNDPTVPAPTYPLDCTGLQPGAPGYGSAPTPGATLALSTPVNVTSTLDVTISETGGADLTVSSVSVTGGPAISVSGPATPFSVVDGSNATETLTVSCGAAAPGNTSGMLTVHHNAAGSPARYPVDCSVTPAPAGPGFDSTPMAPGPIQFGSTPVGGQSIATIVALETGDTDLTLSAPVLGDSTNFQVVTPFPVTVADGSSGVLLDLACRPTVPGQLTTTLTFATDDPANPSVTFDLECTATGIATPAPIPSVSSVGLALLTLLLSLTAIFVLRRQGL